MVPHGDRQRRSDARLRTSGRRPDKWRICAFDTVWIRGRGSTTPGPCCGTGMGNPAPRSCPVVSLVAAVVAGSEAARASGGRGRADGRVDRGRRRRPATTIAAGVRRRGSDRGRRSVRAHVGRSPGPASGPLGEPQGRIGASGRRRITRSWTLVRESASTVSSREGIRLPVEVPGAGRRRRVPRRARRARPLSARRTCCAGRRRGRGRRGRCAPEDPPVVGRSRSQRRDRGDARGDRAGPDVLTDVAGRGQGPACSPTSPAASSTASCAASTTIRCR